MPLARVGAKTDSTTRTTEMLGRALVAQTFVTASLGAVFSLRIRHRLVQRSLTGILQ